MKFSFFLLLTLPMLAQAGGGWGTYAIRATCGEVLKAGNGKILNRLEPGFGINHKFVLKTKYENFIQLNESGSASSKPYTPAPFDGTQVSFTRFADKAEFQHLKFGLKKELKEAQDAGKPLYACSGHISVNPFKYEGNHVYWSHESLEDAIKQFRTKARQHL